LPCLHNISPTKAAILTPLLLTPLGSPHPSLTLKLLDIRQQPCIITPLLEILSVEEQAHYLRYRQPRDQLHFIYGRSALRYYLAELLDTTPQDIAFIHSQHGKPLLTRHDAPCFNVSHSGDYVLLGFHTDAIGVDIEQANIPAPFEILPHLFSAEEQRYCQIANPAARFYQIWTAKEAVLKAWGMGFAGVIPDFSVINKDLSWMQQLTADTQVWTIKLPDGYAGAIALQSQERNANK
jgi:4'-phosphopantetheinyl transferase